jgi:hypothetical protein
MQNLPSSSFDDEGSIPMFMCSSNKKKNKRKEKKRRKEEKKKVKREGKRNDFKDYF